MPGPPNRRILIVVLFVLVVGYFASGPISDAVFYNFMYDGSPADRELVKIRHQVQRGQVQDAQSLRAKCFEIADANSGSRAEVTAYALIATQWPESADAVVALDKLLQAGKHVAMDDLARSFQEIVPDRGERWERLGALLIERVRQEPDHPKAARLLCDAALAMRPDGHAATAPEELAQIADLIQRRYATSPDLARFCEAVSNSGGPARWTLPFERHIRHILDFNQDRFVRCAAHFALAVIVRSSGADRREEAMKLYEDFLTNFDGETVYHAQAIEQYYREEATRTLTILQSLGFRAPETRGVDLDGSELSLNDYRGRVVLVSFWASWCQPCLQAIPHERELLETFGRADFAIFGINVDEDIAKAKVAVQTHGITWRSLRGNQEQPSHATKWSVDGYPMFYLLDRHGVIARCWTGIPPETELNHAIRGLIKSKATITNSNVQASLVVGYGTT